MSSVKLDSSVDFVNSTVLVWHVSAEPLTAALHSDTYAVCMFLSALDCPESRGMHVAAMGTFLNV